VHGEKSSAGFSRSTGCPLDRVLDVEQLHIEEHLLAFVNKLARQSETTVHDELKTDLVKGDSISELVHEGASVLEAG
jgi:hypothetical protein